MTSEPRTARRVRLLAVGILVATFVAGGLTGVAYERVLIARDPAPPMPRMDGPRAPGSPPNIFSTGGPMADRLNLSEDQIQRIEAILEEDRFKAQETFQRMEPLLRARVDSTRQAIVSVLTAQQREEFQRFEQERRERLRGRPRDGPRGGRGGGPGGPRGGGGR